MFFSKGHNARKGDNSDKKQIRVSYLSMRNPYMKFQNPSRNGSQDMECIRFHSDIFSKGHNARKGDNSDKK